ncbi:hypothetical protein [Vulcanisaeta distributa]|nr:hypothetical protein [Vulcanisaeta distributa]
MELLSKLRTKPVIVDTNVRRCYPHTLRDVIRQQLWYGRTWLRYVKLNGNLRSDLCVSISH